MISQFTINLNKGEDIAEREARWRKRREVATMTILILGVLIMSMLNYQQYTTIEGLIQTKEDIIRDVDRQLDSLKKTGKNISKQDVLALAKLEKERVLWTKKFLGLGEELPEEMAVTYMEFKNKMLLLRFLSTVKKDEKEFDRVKNMIDKLRGSPLFFRDFTQLLLKEQHRSIVAEQSVLSFSVLCSIGSKSRSKRRSSSRSRTSSAVRG